MTDHEVEAAAPSPVPPFPELSAAYNWCDGRCERCPLAARCPVRRFDLEGPGPIAVARALGAAVELLDDPRGPPLPLEPESPAAAGLRHACREYAAAVFALRDVLAGAGLDLDQLGADAMLVAGKGGRVAGYVSGDGALAGQAALADGVPNLLLLEELMAEVDDGVAAGSHASAVGAAYRVARDELQHALAPLLGAIPALYRDELRLRAAGGAAPSPFSRSARGP